VMPRVSVSWSTDQKDSRTVGLEAGAALLSRAPGRPGCR